MPLTLNQILSRLETLALSHDQINFYFCQNKKRGEPHEFDVNGEITYPAVFTSMQPGLVDRVSHQIRFNFRIYFLDLVKVSEGTESNEDEVLSDMASVMQDFLAMLMATDFQDDWSISDINNFTYVTEELGDMVAGVVLDVGISTDFLADRCQVPADDSDFIDIDMPRTRIYTYTATGSETNPFNIPGLAAKAILAAWREFAYQRVVVTAPTESGKIKVGTVDLGNNLGILADGDIQTLDSLLPGEKLDFLYYA